MDRIDIKDVTEEGIEDLCWLCVPPEKRDDPDFIRGVEEKKKWAAQMLRKWGSVAKVAYQGGAPVGMIQYKPIPEERTAHHCKNPILSALLSLHLGRTAHPSPLCEQACQ